MQIIDACALINVFNCGLDEVFVKHFSQDICFQGLVEDECSSIQEKLDHYVDKGHLLRFDGAFITAKEVGDIATSYAIGMGESECLAIAKKFGYDFTSDDKRARNTALRVLPKEAKITGTIGLLCILLDNKKIKLNEANEALNAIKLHGGLVPNFDFNMRRIC